MNHEIERYQVEYYRDPRGRAPVLKWLLSLDRSVRSKIEARINRLWCGNWGDCKSLGGGLFELRCAFGPGYRVYFGHVEGRVILLLCGGHKGTQFMDIQKARQYWKDFQVR